ncbi:triose-phosphate transporter family-domain-containing protein [Aspergillus carlsbadensis]|nr:triose-phosphate transporter family-domain-containing protein [Aspergillus carlsbadensis]
MYTNPAPRSQSWNIVLCTLNWVFWSNLTILFNKWILEYTPFKYPILLTTWHLLFATLATQLLAHTTPLLSARKSLPMNARIYMARIAPIGLLYSASLVCSNVAYVYLNVGFIQMLKAAGPVVTLLTSYLWSVTGLTAGKVVNILVIAVSVGVTVSGEIQFSWVGVALQGAALVCDANRLVLMEIITSSSSSSLADGGEQRGRRRERDEEGGVEERKDVEHIEADSQSQSQSEPRSQANTMTNLGKMDPLVSLYYTAPICFAMNAILAWKAEVQPLLLSQLQERSASPATTTSSALGLGGIILETGLSTLFANALVGFLLNVAVFTLIGKTSGLTMTLVSIPKNILLIGASVVLWGTQVSLVQAVGYAVALGGLVVYSGGGGWLAEVLGVRGLIVGVWRVWKRMKGWGMGKRRGRYVEVARKEEGERLV